MDTDNEFALEPGETISLTVRRHWLMFTLELLPFFFAMFVPFLIPILLGVFSAQIPASMAASTFSFSVMNPLVRLALGVWWLFLWTAAFATFTRSFLDLWVITSTRIVNVKQVGLFHRQVESFLLARVQDVSTEVSGFLATLIGIGSVRVETAGNASRTFRMRGLPKPEAIRDLIIREIAELQTTGVRQTP